MSFRRDGEVNHREQREWEAWKELHADLLRECGLPLGVLRSRRDWLYLLRYGYWCEDYYGKHVNNIDFDLNELSPEQTSAFRQLLEQALSDELKIRGCAGWHHVQPPGNEA
jgi:hypothetical protein